MFETIVEGKARSVHLSETQLAWLHRQSGDRCDDSCIIANRFSVYMK